MVQASDSSDDLTMVPWLIIPWIEPLAEEIFNGRYCQDLRSRDEFSGFRTISRGRSPREIVQLRKS